MVLVVQGDAEQDDALLFVDIALFWGGHEALECVVPEVVLCVGHKLLDDDSWDMCYTTHQLSRIEEEILVGINIVLHLQSVLNPTSYDGVGIK